MILGSKSIDLTPSRSKGVFYGHLSMFMSCVVRRGLIDYNVLMRRNRQPDVDLKSGAVAMLMAGCNHVHAAACNALIVNLKPLYFAKYLRTRRIGGSATLEGDLW